jgi:hypothetical protein
LCIRCLKGDAFRVEVVRRELDDGRIDVRRDDLRRRQGLSEGTRERSYSSGVECLKTSVSVMERA